MYKNLSISFLPFLVVLLIGLKATGHDGVSVIEWFGYDDCIELKNDQCRVILTPSFGAKVMHYSLQGKDSLMVDHSEEGFVYDPSLDNSTFNSGGRFDFGWARKYKNRSIITIGKWKGKMVGDRSARLVSQIHPDTGLQFIREFELSESGADLKVTQTMVNRGEKTVSAFYWARTFAKGNGIVVVPRSEPFLYPKGWARVEDGKLAFSPKSDDPAIYQTERFTVIDNPPIHPKMAFDTTAGWCAYFMENDLMMLRHFDVFPEKPYTDVVGGLLSIYYNNDYHGRSVVEIEAIGPRETMMPGEESAYSETWSLFSMDFPERDRKSIDFGAIENFIKR